ncbi:hypothetical protein C2R22_01095 [Salinigranum rubrum]|uniref:Uncharacterized protein n=1 Tax=Salinigranum rubrum TaxID=755307 RepID=A0A2I8VET9_9EURY|nr:hypothetical protein [Salinigranum rubrum]AUV80425.1 hypothetical protein C2R22_01095 [Salinigranum rubrum]
MSPAPPSSSATPPPPSASTAAVVRWRFGPATTRSLRLLVYAAVGLTAGPVLGLLALVGATLVRSGVDVALFALVLALVVGLGVGSGRAVFALGSAPPEVHEMVRALSRWGVAGGVLFGASLALVGLRWTEFGLELLVGSVVAGFAALVVGAGLQSEGVVDREGGTLEYGGHTVPLDAVRRVHARGVGPFVLAFLAYHAGHVGASTPRFAVLSSEAVTAVRANADGNATELDAGSGHRRRCGSSPRRSESPVSPPVPCCGSCSRRRAACSSAISASSASSSASCSSGTRSSPDGERAVLVVADGRPRGLSRRYSPPAVGRWPSRVRRRRHGTAGVCG